MGVVVMDMHDFLIETENREHPAPELVMDLRDHLESMPETRTIFRLSEMLDPGVSGDIIDDALALCGVWRIPDIYPAGDVRGPRVVNPNREDARRYTDVFEWCECGVIFTRPQRKDSHVESAIRGANQHDDDCKPYQRYEMRASLCRQREDIIRSSHYYGVGGVRLGRRLALKGPSTTAVIQRFGIDGDELRESYRQRRANTMAELSRLGYQRKEIAKVYGINPSHVSREVKRRTDTQLREIKEARQ